MLELFLLGRPRAARDGRPVDGVRGTKAWALLAHLLLADGPVSRQRLAALLFPDAADPAAALRWNLSQLRRGLGVGLDGDPVTLTLPPGTWVDAAVLAHGEASEAAAVAGPAQQLLAGVSFGDNEPFTLWLEGERRHLVTLAADVLREAALLELSRGAPGEAVKLAERVVQLAPLDENAAVLLVRSLREAGRPTEALAVADATADRLRDDLGMQPSSALWSTAHASTGGRGGSGGRAAIQAQLEAGEAALAAGATNAGLDALREAVGGSRAIDEPDLLARSLTALGSALIHTVRGSDQDGIALLHEAIPHSRSADLPPVSARAHRELGYVDMLRGRYERARRWFTKAVDQAAGDDEELSWIAAFAGAARTDVADYAAASELLDEAVARARVAEAHEAAAMAHSMRGRMRLLREDASGARDDLDRSIEIARHLAWRSFQPWPQSMRAEVARSSGDLDGAMAMLQPALATGRQIGDPCWESMALRGLGLTTVAQGALTEGLQLLEDAPRQCRRLPDTYLWVEVYGIDALADATSSHGMSSAATWIQRLEEASTSHGMRALRDNAARYRQR